MGRRQCTDALSDATGERCSGAELERDVDRGGRRRDSLAGLGFSNGTDNFLEQQGKQRAVSHRLANHAARSARRVHDQSRVGKSGTEARSDHVLGRRNRREWNARRKADKSARLSGTNRLRGSVKRPDSLARRDVPLHVRDFAGSAGKFGTRRSTSLRRKITPAYGGRKGLPPLSATKPLHPPGAPGRGGRAPPFVSTRA